MEKLIPHLDDIRPAITLVMNDDEKKLLKSFFLLSAQAGIYACNVKEADLATASNKPDEHAFVAAVRKHVSTMHSASAVSDQRRH